MFPQRKDKISCQIHLVSQNISRTSDTDSVVCSYQPKRDKAQGKHMAFYAETHSYLRATGSEVTSGGPKARVDLARIQLHIGRLTMEEKNSPRLPCQVPTLMLRIQNNKDLQRRRNESSASLGAPVALAITNLPVCPFV